MTVETPLNRCCDECSRAISKAKKVFRGKSYCETCYARLFKRRLCAGCGNFARLPTFRPEAICQRCEAAKPCVRCGRTGRPVGRMTPYGPSCNSCAHYFNEPEPCDVCGKMSTQLSRVLRRDPNIRCCPACAHSDAETCPSCRRYRHLVDDGTGRRVCKPCATLGDVACLTCAAPMPGGRGKECEACYWHRTYEKHVRNNLAALMLPITQALFRQFADWLAKRCGEHKASLTLRRYVGLFLYLDESRIGVPSYRDLLERYGAEGLRRIRLPMAWLEEAHGVVVDERMREEHSDRRRIAEIEQSLPAGKATIVWSGYRRALEAKFREGNSSLRSMRLALASAASLLLIAASLGQEIPDQVSLRRYLRNAPGQRATIHGFVRYLIDTHGAKLDQKRGIHGLSGARRTRLEAELFGLLEEQPRQPDFERRWLVAALAYFHGVRRLGKDALSYVRAQQSGHEGFIITVAEEDYWIPHADSRAGEFGP